MHRTTKKDVFQNNFIKHWCKSSHNHPEGWKWWKRHNHKVARLKLNKQITGY